MAGLFSMVASARPGRRLLGQCGETTLGTIAGPEVTPFLVGYGDRVQVVPRGPELDLRWSGWSSIEFDRRLIHVLELMAQLPRAGLRLLLHCAFELSA